MDVYFKNLDSIQDKIAVASCCDEQKNHLTKNDGQVTCKLCKSLITNIS